MAAGQLEAGVVRMFRYKRSFWEWLTRQPKRVGWHIRCWKCNWYLAQPDHRRGLLKAFNHHFEDKHR